jgi:hypothetical protein
VVITTLNKTMQFQEFHNNFRANSIMTERNKRVVQKAHARFGPSIIRNVRFPSDCLKIKNKIRKCLPYRSPYLGRRYEDDIYEFSKIIRTLTLFVERPLRDILLSDFKSTNSLHLVENDSLVNFVYNRTNFYNAYCMKAAMFYYALSYDFKHYKEGEVLHYTLSRDTIYVTAPRKCWVVGLKRFFNTNLVEDLGVGIELMSNILKYMRIFQTRPFDQVGYKLPPCTDNYWNYAPFDALTKYIIMEREEQ